jgi:hypothetical protein
MTPGLRTTHDGGHYQSGPRRQPRIRQAIDEGQIRAVCKLRALLTGTEQASGLKFVNLD